MRTCMCTYLCMHTHVRESVCLRHTCMQKQIAHIHSHTQKHRHTATDTHTRTHIRTHYRTHMHAHMHMYMHMYSCIYMRAFMCYIHTRLHIHIHTHSRPRERWDSSMFREWTKTLSTPPAQHLGQIIVEVPPARLTAPEVRFRSA